MIALFGAMKEEVSGILEGMENLQQILSVPKPVYSGTYSGQEILVVLCGVGKINAAAATQLIIDRFAPEAVILFGVAGALNPEYRIGDLVIAGDCAQHDLDATHFKFKRGQIPYTDMRFFPSDPKWVNRAKQINSGDYTVHTGRIITGDQFVTDAGSDSHGIYRGEMGGDAIEMEGAGVAQVAFMNDVPFLIIRVISDRADGTAPKNYSSFMKDVSQRLAGVVSQLLTKV